MTNKEPGQTAPLVSVIIPTRNRAAMVLEAVDSVLAQSFQDFELIVVDDGSSDDTGDILKKAYGNRINLITQENKGVSSARNRGIMQARGSLIAFLDSDDLWLKEKLSKQVEFFRNNPNALICQTEETWIRKGIRVNPKNKHKKISGKIFVPSLALCLVSPSAVMIKKDLFDQVGLFDKTLTACEDYDLWLRISYRFPIHLIDIPLIIKRGGHDDQLSASPGLDKFRIQSLKNLIDHHSLDSDQQRAATDMLLQKCKIYANGCLKRGKNDEAAFYLDLCQKVS